MAGEAGNGAVKRGRGRPRKDANAGPATRVIGTGVGEITVTPGLVRGLAKIQCTMAEAASVFGIEELEFKHLIRRNRDFWLAWNQGGLVGKVELRRLQWAHAQEKGSAGVAMTIHLSKHWLGEKDRLILEDFENWSDSQIAELIAKQEEILARQDEALAAIKTRTDFPEHLQLREDPRTTRH
jgi:hypothetical protein